MKKLLLFTLTLITIVPLTAQQYPIISNYLTTQYAFNPASTGTINNSQFHLFYRTQWVGFEQAPTTQFASYRSRIGTGPVALGGFVFNDEAGAIQRTGGMALAAYRQQLSEYSSISIGLALGYQNMRLQNNVTAKDLADAVLSEAQAGLWIPDANIGIHIQIKNHYFGLSVPQVLRPQISYENSEVVNYLRRHYYFMAGTAIPISTNISLEPSALVKLSENTLAQIDGSLRVSYQNKFWLGGSYRTDDAIVAMTGFRLGPKLELAYAYDFTGSEIRTVSSGSHEISLIFKWGGYLDTDEDGTPDKQDQCPDQPGPKDTQGCPVDVFALIASKDKDGDGVVNSLDKCPKESGPRENYGCPWPDSDEDGVPDNIDLCPNLAGSTKNEGCPNEDRDKDGIVDALDKCPDDAGPHITRGCPDNDTDKDGLRDQFDDCPYTFGPPSNAGCPIVSTEENDLLEEVKRDLNFETGEVKIWEESKSQLKKLANLLKERVDWQLKIAGHTDNKGSAKTNMEVSKKRAEAVRDFLVAQGVPTEQIIVEYYGESKPLTSNDSIVGRQINRRVELEFIFD